MFHWENTLTPSSLRFGEAGRRKQLCMGRYETLSGPGSQEWSGGPVMGFTLLLARHPRFPSSGSTLVWRVQDWQVGRYMIHIIYTAKSQ